MAVQSFLVMEGRLLNTVPLNVTKRRPTDLSFGVIFLLGLVAAVGLAAARVAHGAGEDVARGRWVLPRAREQLDNLAARRSRHVLVAPADARRQERGERPAGEAMDMMSKMTDLAGYARNAAVQATTLVAGSELEKKLTEATSNEPWGASGTMLAELAEASAVSEAVVEFE